MQTTTTRIERLQRIVTAAASHLDAIDNATIERVAANLAAYETTPLEQRIQQPDFQAQFAGVFSVNMDELLDIIERLSRP